MTHKDASTRDIHFVYGDDWLYVFIDGECVYENHPGDLDHEHLLSLLGVPCKTTGVSHSFFIDPDAYDRKSRYRSVTLEEMRDKFNKYHEWGDIV